MSCLSAQRFDTMKFVLACRLTMDSASLKTILRRTGFDGVNFRFLLHQDFSTRHRRLRGDELENHVGSGKTETDENIFWKALYKSNLLTRLVHEARTNWRCNRVERRSPTKGRTQLKRSHQQCHSSRDQKHWIQRWWSNHPDKPIRNDGRLKDEFTAQRIVETAKIARCYKYERPSLTETCVELYNEVVDETKAILDASYSGVSRRGSNIELLLGSKVNFWKFRKISNFLRALNDMEVFWPSKFGREQELLLEQDVSSTLDDLVACDDAKYAARAWIDKANLRMLSNVKPRLERNKRLNLKDCIVNGLARCGNDEYVWTRVENYCEKLPETNAN